MASVHVVLKSHIAPRISTGAILGTARSPIRVSILMHVMAMSAAEAPTAMIACAAAGFTGPKVGSTPHG